MQFSKFALALISSTTFLGGAFAASGDATWFQPGLGACGLTNTASDFIAAMNPIDYAGGAACNRRVHLDFQGRGVDVDVVDLCPGCALGDIDLSPAAFQQLASLDAGRIQVNWNYI